MRELSSGHSGSFERRSGNWVPLGDERDKEQMKLATRSLRGAMLGVSCLVGVAGCSSDEREYHSTAGSGGVEARAGSGGGLSRGGTRNVAGGSAQGGVSGGTEAYAGETSTAGGSAGTPGAEGGTSGSGPSDTAGSDAGGTLGSSGGNKGARGGAAGTTGSSGGSSTTSGGTLGSGGTSGGSAGRGGTSGGIAGSAGSLGGSSGGIAGSLGTGGAQVVTYSLNITPTPATGGGTVSSNPTGISQCGAAGGTCSASFPASQTVTLTAAAQLGYTFTGWGGACTGSSVVTTVSMTQARSCTAMFTAQYVLTLNVTGSGSVTSSPAGISSCTGACTRKYSDGQVVTLNATPARGYDFKNWSGDCTGTGLSTTVTLSQARTCSANFSSQWARWPMPNPVGLGLPNPQSYDTTTAGVVLDKVTGLMWQRTLGADSYTWSEAQAYCSALGLNGLGGWRLPSRIELISIFDFSKAPARIDATAFPNTPATSFWTTSSGGGSYYYVDFSFNVGLAQPTELSRVRCVREAAAPATLPDNDTPPNRYTIQNNTVYDIKTKLTWQQTLAAAGTGSASYSWADASTYCANLDLNGPGWRLPSVKELSTLILENGNASDIDPTAFPNTPTDGHGPFWASSVSSTDSTAHGMVLFESGYLQFNNAPAAKYYARCVR